MTEEEFEASLNNIPLHYERDTADGLGTIRRAHDGTSVYVDKPVYIRAELRTARIQLLRELYAPQRH